MLCGHASITDQMCMPSASAFVWLIYKLRLRGALTGFPKSALNLTLRWHPDVHIWAGLNEQQYCLPAVNVLMDTGLFLLSKAAVTIASNHTLMHLPDHQIILWFCSMPWHVPRMPDMCHSELVFLSQKRLFIKNPLNKVSMNIMNALWCSYVTMYFCNYRVAQMEY